MIRQLWRYLRIGWQYLRGWRPMRVYYLGVEINKITPRLAFLDDDDWMESWFRWLREQSDWDIMYTLLTKPPGSKDSKVRGVWVCRGDEPPKTPAGFLIKHRRDQMLKETT